MMIVRRNRLVVRALAALALAVVSPAWANAPSYVGSEACAECHGDKSEKIRNSIHSKMIRDATIPGNVHGNLSAPKAPTMADITHVIGGWYKEESYIKKEGETWTVTNFEWNPITQKYANDKPLRDWLVKSAGCHTTGYDPATKKFAELNIGCEACHGPGGDHINSTLKADITIDKTMEGCGHCHIRAESAETADFPAKTFNFPIGYQLGKPETLQYIPEPPTATASFLPDQFTSKRHRQQMLDIKNSKHYPNITCIKCHDPHDSGILTVHDTALPAGVYGVKIWDNSNGTFKYSAWDGDGLKKPKEEVCLTCHSSVSEHHAHYFTPAAEAAKVTCTDCHMPDIINVDATTLRGPLSPHTFRVLRPETSMKLGPDAMPNSCTYRCHQDKGTDKTARALWAASYLSPKLETLPLAFSEPFKVRLHGVRNFTYSVETSSDLKAWTPLGTPQKVPVSGLLDVPDPDSLATPYRFYRALEK